MSDAASPDQGYMQRPVSKTAYVLDRMREEIAGGVIVPGQPLKQTDLAARYGVSPTPVREALRILEAEGSISYSPHRGSTVAQMDAPKVRDLYLLRASMESLATRLTVERLNETSTLEMIRTIHSDISASRETTNAVELSRMNRHLHFAIYTSGSPTIAEHISSLWRLLPATETLWDRRQVADVFVAQHEKIVEAITARDAGAAAAFMHEHVLTAGRFREEQLTRHE